MFNTFKPGLGYAGVFVAVFGVFCHKSLAHFVFYPLFRIVFGLLYPAYASYKAVRTKNVKEYVKWMMYWIVFAIFTCAETFTDILFSWFPFYYEIKIIIVVWLLSPATKGSSILYRKFVHPMLSSREQEIDEYISKAKEQSYKQVLDLGSKGVTVLMQTAIKGGGGLVSQLRKSYSLSDLSQNEDGRDEGDVVSVRRRHGHSQHRPTSTNSAIFFSEVDVRADRIAEVQSTEDISSGYSSSDGLYIGQALKPQARESVHRSGSLTRTRSTRVARSTVPKKSTGSDESDENETFDTNIIFFNDRAKQIDKLKEKRDSSSSENEFFDSNEKMHGKTTQNDLNNTVGMNTCLIACEKIPENTKTLSSLKQNLNLVNITKDVDTFSKFVQELIETNSNKCPNTEEHKRGGKYNKKTAPIPPAKKQHDNVNAPPIKATLVLQPGVVKIVPTNNEQDTKNELFLQTTATRRKTTLDRTPSTVRKMEETFGKILKLPKKMTNHLALPKSKTEKRLSWNDLFGRDRAKNLLEVKVRSKSDNNLEKIDTTTTVVNLTRTGSKLSIKSLTESPASRRRLKIVKK